MNFWVDSLVCPVCRGELDILEQGRNCPACQRFYPVADQVFYFLETHHSADLLKGVDGDAMVQGYRQPSALLGRLRQIISSEYFPGKAWRSARSQTLTAQGGCLVMGSGVSRYENACHLDIDDFPGVDVVADAHRIPFADNSFSGVICEVVLEHVPNPTQIISEAWRVLRPGGRVFFIVPFLFPFHGHPHDYRRWSRQGLETDFAQFKRLEIGIHGGPCSSMVNLLSEWVYVLSGFAFPKAYVPIKGAATALLFPLKFLDLIVNRFPEAHRLASTLYVSGYKS